MSGVASDIEAAWQLHLDGNSEKASQALEALLARTNPPMSHQITTALGLIALDTNETKKAVGLFESLTQACPNDANAWNNYALALRRTKQHREAAIAYNKALTLEPDNVDIAFNLASVLLNMQELIQAGAIFNGIIQHYPQHSKSLHNLGVIAGIQGDSQVAAEFYQRSIEGDAPQAETMANLATLLTQCGKAQAAQEWFDKAVELEPNAMRIQSNRLQNMLYLPDTTLDDMAKAHKAWGNAIEAIFPVQSFAQPTWQKDDVIRIGYFSADFRVHSVAYFMEAILKHHSPKVEVYCYFHDNEGDAFTDHLKQFNVTWRDLARLTNEQRREVAIQDSLHIVVELHGHTNNHILPWFTQRVAPIQMTYLGYPFSTGLSCIDYRLTDATVDPESAEGAYSETLLRLSAPYLAYSPQHAAPKRDKQDYITFGSFNNLAKYNPPLLQAWASILKQVPNSRLLIKNKGLAEPTIASALEQQCVEAGINKDQLELVGWLANPNDHLNLYGQVDIALDTAPYHGTTTTCEALTCGAPVITWVGDTPQQRVGKTLLEAVDAPELATDSLEAYIQCAVDLAHDPERLATYHTTLAAATRESPLCDGQGLVQRLESAYMNVMSKHYHAD